MNREFGTFQTMPHLSVNEISTLRPDSSLLGAKTYADVRVMGMLRYLVDSTCAYMAFIASTLSNYTATSAVTLNGLEANE